MADDRISSHFMPDSWKADGWKADQGKTDWALLPPDALQEVAEVFTRGAEKYGPRNWEKGLSYGRVFSACMRHLWSFWMGEENDPEWGKHHLAHAACCVLFLLTYQLRKKYDNFDDRVKL